MKNTTIKKLLSLFLAIAIMVCVIPFGTFTLTASAESEEYTEDYYTYMVSNGMATITEVNTSISGDVTIPSTLGGYSVTSIGDGAFFGCTSLTSVTIGGSVTSVGDGAFSKCISLTEIKVSANNSNYSSSNGILFNKDKTSLICYPAGKENTSYIIPDNVTSIGDRAFSVCKSLKSITIGDSVTSIGWWTFSDCTSLTSITIPNSVTSIGFYVFNGCTSLERVSLGSNVTSIGSHAFCDCTSLTNITIPDSVTSIGSYAFCDCTNLESITIGDSVTSIGDVAFYNCTSLTDIMIPDSVTSIGDVAFYNCSGIINVYYEGTAEEWGAIAIYRGNHYLSSATIHYNCSDFSECALKGHKYDNNCDKTCNVCKATRKVPAHKYKTTAQTKATLKKNGSITQKCTACGKISKSTIKYAKTFKLSATSYTYNGKVKTPIVTVKDSAGNKLKKNVDYTLSSSSGRKNVGTYKVTIKMKG